MWFTRDGQQEEWERDPEEEEPLSPRRSGSRPSASTAELESMDPERKIWLSKQELHSLHEQLNEAYDANLEETMERLGVTSSLRCCPIHSPIETSSEAVLLCLQDTHAMLIPVPSHTLVNDACYGLGVHC